VVRKAGVETDHIVLSAYPRRQRAAGDGAKQEHGVRMLAPRRGHHGGKRCRVGR
jgi:hypothetical protein